MREALFLGALFGVLFLLRLDTPGLFDYDEGCYAEVSRVMHAEGEWLAPTLNGEPFFEKPPFLYWTQIVGYHLCGVRPLGARLINAVAAVALVLALFVLSRRPLGQRAAFFAALFLGTSFEYFGLARVAFTDMLLALWLTLCLGCFHRAAEAWRQDPGGGTVWFLAACLFSGLAMLTKGAIGVFLPAAAILLFLLLDRRLSVLFRPLRLCAGIVVLLGVGMSWYLLLGLTQPGGFAFMQELFLEHHVGRFSEPMQGHSGPFFFYLPVLIGGFLPWSPLLLPALAGRGITRSEGETRRYLLLMGYFAAITLVFFSAAATKLPNYIGPILPVAALLAAHAMVRQSGTDAAPGKLWNAAAFAACGSLLLLAGLLLAAPFILAELPDLLGEKALKRPGLAEPFDLGPWPFITAALLAAAALAAIALYRRRRLIHTAWCLAGGVTAFYLAVTVFVLPRYDAHFGAPLRAVARRAAAEAPAGKPVVLLGIRHAPSVIFYGGRPTRYVSRKRPQEIAALFAGPGPEVGITVAAYAERIQGPGRLEILDRQRGYVLFRCSPAVPEGAGR